MANQQQSRDSAPQQDSERPGADTGRQDQARTSDPARQEDRGDGPAKVGLTSDQQPGLVAPSGVNERDRGAAADGGSVNLDDDDMVHPRGKTTAAGGTWKAEGGDSAPLGSPGAGLSDRNGPSDPDAGKQ